MRSVALADRRVWQSAMMEVTSRLDGSRKLVKGHAEPMVDGNVGGEFVVAAADVLDEGVPAARYQRTATVITSGGNRKPANTEVLPRAVT